MKSTRPRCSAARARTAPAPLAAAKGAGVELSPVGDFSLYDHVLDAQLLVGAVPPRFGFDPAQLSTEQYFQLARGNAKQPALEMTKWFDTNYHYLVPEWHADTAFQAQPQRLLAQVREAQALGLRAKPVLLGPLSLLWLGKSKGADFDKLALLPGLLQAYRELLAALAEAKVEWVQIDEPILALDLPQEWLTAFDPAYQQLQDSSLRLLLATYFGSVAEHAERLKRLPVAGLHLTWCARRCSWKPSPPAGRRTRCCPPASSMAAISGAPTCPARWPACCRWPPNWASACGLPPVAPCCTPLRPGGGNPARCRRQDLARLRGAEAERTEGIEARRGTRPRRHRQ